MRSTSASRQSETTRSINSALRSNPMIDLIDQRSSSKENLGRSSRESSRPGSRSQLSSSSKENIGVSSRDIARSSSKENMQRSNVGYRDSLRSSSTENIKANVLGSRENVSRGLRENVVANKRRSARASTMSNFGGYSFIIINIKTNLLKMASNCHQRQHTFHLHHISYIQSLF